MPHTSALFEEGTARLALRGFVRSIAELEWLVLVLVMLQTVVMGDAARDRVTLVGGMVVYAAFVLIQRYAASGWRASRIAVRLECAAMFAFMTWSLYGAGPAGAPLVNLYLLLIVASALVLGRIPTALLLILVALALGPFTWGAIAPPAGLAAWNELLGTMIPLVLVAWVTTLLAGDLAFTRSVVKDWFATDDLTGLPTPRGFNEALEGELRRSARCGGPCSVMLIDVDRLKAANDTHGHGAGNLLLISIANAISGMARTSDIPARLGGDEFALLLPGTDLENARQVAERVLAQVQRSDIHVEGGTLHPSVSIGIASFPAHGVAAQALMKAADAALYAAKREGRGRIATAGDPAPVSQA